MSFGQKNTWPRPAAPSGQINPAMFSNITGQQFSMLNVPNINALVNQAAFGNIIAQQQQRPPLLQQIPQQQRNQSPVNKKRSFVGAVSKFLDTYGFIDDEVFFQASVVTGGQPSIGVRCMVEAVYNSSMPFHWNATSVQIIPDNNPPVMHNNIGGRNRLQGGNRWDPSPSNGPDNRSRGPPDDRYNSHRGVERDVGRVRSPLPRREPRPPIRRSPARRLSPGKSPVRRPEKRERTPRAISPRRDTSVRGSREPPRRRARITPRYACRPVKPVINKHVTCADLRSRYKSLYIPSDFVSAEMSWLDSFPLDAPSQIGANSVTFHVCHKDVDFESDIYTPEQLTPPTDEDHRFTVRVLFLANPDIVEFRKKVFSLLPDGSIDESNENINFNKAIHFLTGIRGRNEAMAIGGAWSPTVDGGDPTSLAIQIKVAVRSTLQLTGLDLSSVSTWYKMAHLEYYRAERDRVDNVVLLLLDTSSLASLMPSPEVYAATVAKLKEQLATKTNDINAKEFVSTVDKRRKEAAATAKPAPIGTTIDPASTTTTAPPTTVTTIPTTTDFASADVVADTATNEVKTGNDEVKMETDESLERMSRDTNISTLRVNDLREQLTLRGLDTKGVKNVLIQRLQKAINDEKAASDGEEIKQEPEAAAKVPVVDAAALTEDAKKEEAVEFEIKEEEFMEIDATAEPEITLDQLEEKEDEDDYTAEELEEIRREREKFDVINNEHKSALTRHYVFPEQPTLLIFPSKTAKNGRFDCKVSSLAALLEYRVEDNKEASFEVFVFAEAIREMFDRSAAFSVYKTLQSANDLDVEVAKRKEALLAAYNTPAPDTVLAETTVENETSGDAKLIETTTEDATAPVKEEALAPVLEKPEIDDRELLIHFKQLVGNFDAFTAFAHFDYNVVGYITVQDLEEILLSIGLRLSRGDILRLCKRLSSRDRVNYRIFTDRLVNKNLEVKYISTPKEDVPTHEMLIEVHPRSIADESVVVNSESGSSEFIVYKGAALNVKQAMEEHEETKSECTKLHTLVQEQEHVLKNYKEQVDSLEKRKKRLESDVSYYRKKAHDADKLLKTNEDELVIFRSALVDSRRLSDRIITIVDRTLVKKEKTKEPESTDGTKKNECFEKKDATESGGKEGSPSGNDKVDVSMDEANTTDSKDKSAESSQSFTETAQIEAVEFASIT